jgi:hypothetical protein
MDRKGETLMLVVRNSFVAKPGNAGKLVAMLKDATAVVGLHSVRVMTDVTGDFNRVVMEHQVENLAALEAVMQQYRTNETVREKMKGYTDLWITGTREVFQIV